LEIALVDTEQTIGREAGNSTCIESKKISRHHARIYPKDQEWVIEDLKSTNGVFVNDEKVREAPLRHGNIVKLGPFSFRFVLEQSPTTPKPQVAESAFESDHTHYGGDPGVIERLVQQEETKNVPPKPPLYVPPKVLPAPDTRLVKSSLNARYLSRGLIAVLLILGTAYLYNYFRDRVIERQVENYTVNFRRFIDTSESDHVHSLESELVEIRKLATHVDEAAERYPATDCQGEFADKDSSCQLRDLQASVLFLAVERWLDALIEDGRIEHAERFVENTEELIEKTRSKQGVRILPEFERGLVELLRKPGGQVGRPPEQQLYTVFNNVVVQRIPEELPGGGSAESAYVPSNEEIRELLKLARIAVEFKRFESEFPDPANPVSRWPDSGRLLNLQDKKRELGERMRAKNAVLSGTYKYFKRLMKQVDEKDSNLIDRWSSRKPLP
jgi:pSer/pThr/pTyr-binding forkhead associated (FHA) protein